MVSLVQPIKMLILVINTYLFITAKGDNEHLSNYTDARESCHNRGGLITQKMFKFGGLINITCELGVDKNVLKIGESVWVQGRAKTGPYIALHTCMRFSSQDKHRFARNRTFHSNILYECSVFCDQILQSNGFFGIYKDLCFCMYYSFRFPHTPECLENDFMDTHKRIIVFKLMQKHNFDIQSKSEDFNCLGASFQEGGRVSYFNTKCALLSYSICSQRVDSDLSNKCLPKKEGFCIIEENSTFLEHYRKCWLYNGALTPFHPKSTLSLNFTVILGSFRALKTIEDDGENKANFTWSCLSITQVNGTLYLETEDCSNKNAYYCINDFPVLPKTSDTEENVTTDGVIIYSVPIIILIYILIPTGTVIGIVIAIVIWWTCRRQRKSRGTSQNDTPQQSDETENRNPQAEMIEVELPLYAESTISEAENNLSQYVPEVQQSTNIYNHLQIWQDEDDNTYDMARFQNV